jgi:hypothetical protein
VRWHGWREFFVIIRILDKPASHANAPPLRRSKKKVDKIAPLALRNFSNPDRPFFAPCLSCIYWFIRNGAKKPLYHCCGSNYLSRPSQTVTFIRKIKRRGERVVVCPPRSRATFKISVLGYRNSGVQYHPPLPRATPLTKKIGGLRSLRSQSLHGTLKGGDSPFPIGNGLRSRKKCKRPCLHFFLLSGGVLPPRRYSDTAGRTKPAPSRLTFKLSVLCPTADVNKNPSQFRTVRFIR